MRTRCSWLLLSLIISSAHDASAQTTIGPAFLEFTASADHDLLDDSGQPLVARYDFLLYTLGSLTPTRVIALGKPTPDATGTIRIVLSGVLNPLPADASTYQVRIAAIGASGTGLSTLSNGFAFQEPCGYTVSPGNRTLGGAGGTNTFSVTAPAGCAWTAATTAAWITITSGSSGSGNGTIAFSVASNPTAATRSGTLTIAGRTVTLLQAIAAAPSAPTGMRIVR